MRIGVKREGKTINWSGKKLKELPLKELPKDVISLDLSNNNLETLPPGLGDYTTLTSLNLSNNPITSLPIQLVKLAGSLNSFRNDRPHKFVDLYDLKLVKTSLKELPSFLGHMPLLTKLDLGFEGDYSNVPYHVKRHGTDAICYFLRQNFSVIQVEISELSRLVKETLNTEFFSDITFLVKGRPIHAHRALIEVRIESPKIQELLLSDTREVTVQKCSYSSFFKLMQFVYTDMVWKPEAGDRKAIKFMLFLEEWQIFRFGCNIFNKGTSAATSGVLTSQGEDTLESSLGLLAAGNGNPRFADLKIVVVPNPEGDDGFSEAILEEMKNLDIQAEASHRGGGKEKQKEKERGKEQEKEKEKGRNEIAVHKFILCKRSPYFAAKFTGSMIDSQDTEIRIEGYDAEIVEKMIHFIYTDKLEPSDENVVDLLALSGLYDLERMQSICMFYIEQNVNVENVVSLLEVADWYQALHLKSFCVTFIIKNFHLVKDNPDWQGLREKNPVLYRYTIQLVQAG